MAKHIIQKKGQTFRYNNSSLEVLPFFLYEVSIFRIEPFRAQSLSCKYFISNKFLDVPEIKVIKRFNKLSIERFITLVGAPMSFIEELDLPPYILQKSKKNEKKRAY